MINLSLNINGLRKSFKKFALSRLVNCHKPNVILIQETMGEEQKFIDDLLKP
jgi:exonuclease III